ncbi:MAG: hypothetical protein ACD_29C00465G0003 [uncultured bacterium]|nr:MAG: hypothetical protein ACD_29C00465G0003 [uncultured bacterium]OGT25463.1 MAG: pseudaminic acid cytidylyltransferase [Gammaproteobacteria bacterium RIFCSPHIGHO2_02_FULL_42_43]OGT27530.1 MAG: pseudaminic acid cytidylyltransferase [Gammaproteobacteria bacterium RIFCSPHIGHO2_01_FULL_42_8]OGT51414.1 MAG: pseudaminic acid cytidylyltransferase [Gammaproteobacteria bacterium RIFCSPHIGHO2_12_FULL_41_25]OGT62116.1 MAG: pseudaminic acid cytidylyltransferase [Gammaproteobacteria bacterium RIFCSPLOWO
MNLAVITARGGSKRIPRKNIKEFCGKPIIAYSIEAALNSNCFDEVMVSTDDDEIAEISKKYGAKVPFMRSKETADDFATTAEVLFEVVNQYRKNKKYFKYLCCLYPTAPFLTRERLLEAFIKLKNNSALSVVFPVVKYSFPVQRALHFKNERIHFLDSAHALTRSQDLTPSYHDAGQFYWMRTVSFLKNKQLLQGEMEAIILPETHVQDIDMLSDWQLAEYKYEYWHSR